MQGKASFSFLLATAIVYSAATESLAAKNSSDYYNEGLTYAKQGRFDLAEESFKKTVEVNPYFCLGYYGLGRIYMYKKDSMEKAITCLEESVKLDPDFAAGYFYLGMAQMLSKKYVSAIHSFSSAYEKNSMFYDALYNIGAIYDLFGDDYKALTYYRMYIIELEKPQNKKNIP